MPTYEYECGGCEHRFEEFQGITDAKLTTCPECGEESLQRLIGAGAAVLFKGSGFYQTDYRSDDYNSKAKADKDSSSGGSSSSSDAKGDSKSGSKSEAKADTPTAPKSDAKPAPSSD